MCVLPLPEYKPWNGNQPDVYLCWDGERWLPTDFGDIKTKRIDGRKLTAFKQGQERRQKFLEALIETQSVKDSLKIIGVSSSCYTRWRQKYPRFAAECDLARSVQPSDRKEYIGSFADFRRLYLGMETTWFQQVFVTALEECKPGEIILVLWPPEHGKTTTIEDFCNYKLALAPQTRISVVSEKQGHSKKILRRVMNRMDPEGPCPLYVSKFGPFVPDEASGKHQVTRQPWAADHFDVRQRGQFDERDYSMSAVGITTSVQSTRADWLIGDDLQCLKTLGQTESYVNMLRQDFFSRPGMKGRICLTGTRVGNNDVWEKLIDEGLIDKLIVFPAQLADGSWLWPEAYTPAQYAGMRKRVGEQAWFRNYMQRPSAAKDATFTEDICQPSLNPSRSVIADAPQDLDEAGRPRQMSVCVNLDPALGSINAITALGFGEKRLYYLGSRVDSGFTRNEEIFDVLEQTIIRWNQPGVSHVDMAVIETMNFQQGLANDERMLEMERRYGFRKVPHLTGNNKYDPNIGIPSMALSFMRGEIDLPFADKVSQDEINLFLAELYAWRPYKRGNRLRQDRVVSFWFGWIRWRAGRLVTAVDPSQFSSTPSPLVRAAS